MIETGRLENASPLAIRVCELDFELDAGYTITREDVTQTEFLAHRLYCDLREEVRETKRKMDQLRTAAPPRRMAEGF